MPNKKPSWEDADILLRIDELAARPETRIALDWFRKEHLGSSKLLLHEKGSQEYEYMMRFIELFETLGTFVKFGILNEELVHERWMSRAPWSFFKPTIQRERETLGSGFAENFEWLAERNRKRFERKQKKKKKGKV